MNITDDTPTWWEALGWFLGEYLPRHRGMSPHTIESYGTALRFFLEKPDGRTDHPCEAGVNEVLRFLEGLEKRRGNTASTRNQRLAALKSFWKAMPLVDPDHRTKYEQLLSIPFKRCTKRSPDYLEPEELAVLFKTVDPTSPKGFRDLVLLRYAYNTGSRISELARARTEWLLLEGLPEVTIRGKGGKARTCPLWKSTAELLRVYLRQEQIRPKKGYEGFLFITRLGTAFNRKALWRLIKGYLRRAAENFASLRHKRLTAHSLRHTTACHMLRAGVEINAIKAWLGHADVSTTSQYLDLDLDKKREALEKFLKLDIDRLTPVSKQARAPLPAHLVAWLERL